MRGRTQDLATDCILVDLQGGEPAGQGTIRTSPGLILVMDESGNLVMHDEVAETEEWEQGNRGTGRATAPLRLRSRTHERRRRRTARNRRRPNSVSSRDT